MVRKYLMIVWKVTLMPVREARGRNADANYGQE
jgi:hypothetical protein